MFPWKLTPLLSLPSLRPISGTGSEECQLLSPAALRGRCRAGKHPLPIGAIASPSRSETGDAGELAETLTMTRGAILKIIDKLESKAWIRRRVKPEDNRVQLLSLTPAGRRAIPELSALADHNDDRFFAPLDAAEKCALRDLLIKLVTHHQIRDVPVE